MPDRAPLPDEPGNAAPGDLPVTRKAWARPGCHPATLYRIDGGGHGWPGGSQLTPARAIGPITRRLDATGLLLDMAERETAIALGYPVLEQGEIALAGADRRLVKVASRAVSRRQRAPASQMSRRSVTTTSVGSEYASWL